MNYFLLDKSEDKKNYQCLISQEVLDFRIMVKKYSYSEVGSEILNKGIIEQYKLACELNDHSRLKGFISQESQVMLTADVFYTEKNPHLRKNLLTYKELVELYSNKDPISYKELKILDMIFDNTISIIKDPSILTENKILQIEQNIYLIFRPITIESEKLLLGLKVFAKDLVQIAADHQCGDGLSMKDKFIRLLNKLLEYVGIKHEYNDIHEVLTAYVKKSSQNLDISHSENVERQNVPDLNVTDTDITKSFIERLNLVKNTEKKTEKLEKDTEKNNGKSVGIGK